MNLVIVTGHPASGKTTLARYLARELELPCLAKDDVKEVLFDTLGWSTREWSKKLGVATYELIYHIAKMQLQADRSLVIEFNFDSQKATPAYLRLQAQHPFVPIQIVLEAADEILLERYEQRANTTERHPGHVDNTQATATIMDEYRARLALGPYQPLAIGGAILRVNTDDFERVNYASILDWVKSEMATC